MNHLAFELVASVVVFCCGSTPDAHVLVPVLVPPASPVVLVQDETAVALDPVLVDVFATRTVVVIVVFAAETVSVAAVVAGPAVWVHHACLERSSGSSPPILISISLAFLALRVMPYAAVPLHT